MNNAVKTNQHLEGFIKSVGITLISLYVLGCFFFANTFAELHIKLPFLNFPIFLGEILLFICFLFYVCLLVTNPPKWSRYYGLAVVYIVFVLVKVVHGYLTWGPLALRHSALYYYPMFALVGYRFYQKGIFNEKAAAFFLPIFYLLISLQVPRDDYILTIVFLSLILISTIKNRHLSLAAKVLLLASISITFGYNNVSKYLYITEVSRTVLVSRTASILFVVFAIVVFWTRTRLRAVLVTLLTITAVGYMTLNPFVINYFKSQLRLSDFREVFEERDQYIQERKATYVRPKTDAIKLFNPNKWNAEATYFSKKLVIGKVEEVASLTKDEIETSSPSNLENNLQGKTVLESWKRSKVEPRYYYDKGDSISKKDVSNSIVRVLIWRDMVVEFLENKPIFGFDFGKPLRSISLEIMDHVTAEWKRDGWISAHNSYLHLFYRSGVFGFLYFLIFIFMMIKIIKAVLRSCKITGVLLTGILICWFVAANFLPILELPHNAILIWTIMGITLAYARENQPVEA